MILAADATARRKLMGSIPREKPIFHVLMGDVMPGLYLPTSLADFLLLAIFYRSLLRSSFQVGSSRLMHRYWASL